MTRPIEDNRTVEEIGDEIERLSKKRDRYVLWAIVFFVMAHVVGLIGAIVAIILT